MIKKPLIDILAFGGTIAMSVNVNKTDPSDAKKAALHQGVIPQLSAEDLVQAVLGLDELADIRTQQLANVGSANLTYHHIKSLIQLAKQSDADAFIVTQGTDTMEETAFLTSLFWSLDKPIVFTGAMRNAASPGADGPANLSDAVRVAIAGKLGVYVVMNGEIHDPCRVRKAHTSHLSAFRSDGGELGVITEGQAHFNQALSRFAVLDLPESLPSVAQIMCTLDQDTQILDFIHQTIGQQTGYAGLVVEAFGGGHVSEAWHDKLSQIAQAIPVILSARPAEGRVLKATYGYKGAEISLIEAGLRPSGRLNGMKARLLLQTCLAAQLDWRYMFERYADLW